MPVATEVALVYGNDLTVMANGDLLLSQDSTAGPQATFERVLRILMTNPTPTDGNGKPIGRPDYLEHPTFGSGIKAAIGEPPLPSLLRAIEARILNALKTDPFIASVPKPSVTWTQLAVDEWQVIVSCSSILGEPYTLPAFALTQSGVIVIGA